jgi:hypothetical protein
MDTFFLQPPSSRPQPLPSAMPPGLADAALASPNRQTPIRAEGRPAHVVITTTSNPQVGRPEADDAWADPMPALEAWLVDEVDLDPAQARRWLEQLATLPAPDACPAIRPTAFAHRAPTTRTDLP